MKIKTYAFSKVFRFACVLVAVALPSATPAAEFRLATFSADITCPLGHACMGGGISPAKEIVDPLLARGVVLLGPEATLVFCAADWCEIRNDAYETWRKALADAAGTTPDHVFFSTVHQHDTPVADSGAQALLDAHGLEKSLCDVVFNDACAQKTAHALKAALASAVTVTHYGVGEGRVVDVASNRRVVSPEGKVDFPRNSATSDPAIRAAPEGTIDPFLKTLSFWNGDKPLAALHAYAVHPMSYYGKGGVSADFPGMARARRQSDDPGTFQIYFSGCSGDVTAGKFNDGNPANRAMLANKIYDGMCAAWKATTRHPLESARVRVARLTLPIREEGGYRIDELNAALANPQETTFNRNLAAMGLAWRVRHDAGKPIDVPAADFGRAAFLLMPGESFVGYQLFAQQVRRDQFVLTAGYGESAPGYIPTKDAEDEDFIERHNWCWVARGAHIPMETAIREALGAK